MGLTSQDQTRGLEQHTLCWVTPSSSEREAAFILPTSRKSLFDASESNRFIFGWGQDDHNPAAVSHQAGLQGLLSLLGKYRRPTFHLAWYFAVTGKSAGSLYGSHERQAGVCPGALASAGLVFWNYRSCLYLMAFEGSDLLYLFCRWLLWPAAVSSFLMRFWRNIYLLNQVIKKITFPSWSP